MLFPPLNPPPTTWLDIVGNYILLGAGIFAVLFLLSYGFLSNWRKYPGGRSIFYFVSGLAAVFVYSIISRFIGGDYLFRDLLRAVVYGYVLVVSARFLTNLLRTQFGDYLAARFTKRRGPEDDLPQADPQDRETVDR